MEIALLLLLLPIPPLAFRADDPAPGVWQTRTDSRNYECFASTEREAHPLHPDEIPAPPGRIYQDTPAVLTCRRRILSPDERAPRDEGVLEGLTQQVETLAQAASTHLPEDVVWHVDAFHGSPQVGAKIAVAARMGLVARHRKVSDRVPVLAAGDVSVLGKMSPASAYPLACARYFAEGSLGPHDVFLGVMALDVRETQLHAGLCQAGLWTWLQ